MKKKNEYKRRTLVTRIILSLLASFCVLILCALFFTLMLSNSIAEFGKAYSSSSCESESPNIFEGRAQVSLPPSYDNFQSTCGGIQGWWAEAVFDINSDELELFLSSTHIDMSTLSNGLPDQARSVYLRNNPPMPAPYLWATYNEESDWVEEVIVDTSNPNRWTVYFTVLGG